MMSGNSSADPYPSPSSFWGDAPGNKCPRAPVTGPKIPLIKPEDLVLPPPQKRINSHSGEIRMLSEPLPIYVQSISPTGAASSAYSDFDFEDSSISSIGLESFSRASSADIEIRVCT